MNDLPFSFTLPMPGLVPSRVDNHIVRRLSQMRGMYLDQAAYEAALAQEDRVIYEVFEIRRPEAAGELPCGISVVHPGKIGGEFYMTKGHFHAVLETSKSSYCLQGEGFMILENPEGEPSVEVLSPGRVLYIPPRWAHRSVCTSRQEDLATFFAYPGNAGHDYGTIEKQGFRKLVLDGPDGIQIVDNPRWRKA